MKRTTVWSFLGRFCTALLLAGCSVGRPGPGPGGDAADLAVVVSGGNDAGLQAVAHLTGRVVAPQGTIPISGALVYASTTPPPPIPDGTFCDKCVHLAEGTPYTQTRPDGTFDLQAFAGQAYLVVQKGAFRRVRPLAIQAGSQQVPSELTTLPAITDKAHGDDVPRIAVVLGAWDPIELVLARMGLKATISKDGLGRAQVLSKDAQGFAIYGLHNPFEVSPYPAPTKLLTDPQEIGKYHIVFIPCSGSPGDGSGEPACSGVFDTNPKVKSTLTGFVQQGGRLYASDWSYEYVRQLFPPFISWNGATQTLGSACSSGGGTQAVTAQDPGLTAWLSAQGQSLPDVKDAWTALTGVKAQTDLDADGKMVTVTPKVWVAAGAPVTASFQHGCGRVLYSTYHTQPTSETNAALEPQALALLYLILEVAVCIDPIIIG